MKRLFVLAIVAAVVIVMTAKYLGLFSGPVVLGGEAISLVLSRS